MSDLVAITVHVPYANVRRLENAAKKSGYTLHRYMQKLIGDLSNAEPHVYRHDHGVVNSDGTIEGRLTETVVVHTPLDLGLRLHAAARQMRDPSGAPVSPTWLARQIVLHYIVRKSDIMDRVRAEVDPAYVDHVPFQARTLARAGRVLYPMPVKFTFAHKETLFAVAKQKGMSVTRLVLAILDKAVPQTGATAA